MPVQNPMFVRERLTRAGKKWYSRAEVKEAMQEEKRRALPYVSIALVAANVLLFLVGEMDGGRINNAGMLDVYHFFVRGEYWRIVTFLFLHSGIDHIFNNMVMLYFMGTMIEREIGHLPYGAIYFLSGLGSGAFSLWMKLSSNSMVGTVGASGAIFGLDGLLLSVVLSFRGSIPNITPRNVMLMIGLSLYSGLRSSNVDNAGHIGGLIIGFLLGMLFCGIRKRRLGDAR